MFELYYKDVAPNATISVTSETPTFERRFLIDSYYATQYQSNGSNTLLNFDLGSAFQISGVAVLNSSIDSTATKFDFRSGATSGLTDTPVAMNKERDSLLLQSANRRYYGIDIAVPSGNIFVGKVIFFQSYYAFEISLNTSRGSVPRFLDVTNAITGTVSRQFVNYKFTGDFEIPLLSVNEISIAENAWQQPYVLLNEPDHGLKYGIIEKSPDVFFANGKYKSFFTFMENV